MNLKNLRLKANLTQEEIANKLKMQKQTYQNYELGKRQPDFETLIKIADYFKTTTDNLLDHKVPYLLDISTLTLDQQNLIDKIKQLSNENCQRVDAYITGLIVAEEEKQKIINLYRKGENK